MSDNDNKENAKLDNSNLEVLILFNEFLKLLNKKEDEEEEEIHSCTCDVCGRENFNDYRYKCLICDDYDLCSRCFENRKISKQHANRHPMVRFEKPNELFGKKYDHENINEINLTKLSELYKTEKQSYNTCDSCGMEPIVGMRLHCEICNDYDLCFRCFKLNKTSKNHELDHVTIAFCKPESFEIDPDKIEIIKELGSGAFGTVYKAKLKPDNKIVACKIIQYMPMMSMLGMSAHTLAKSYMNELSAYNKIKGSNILRMIAHFSVIGENTFKLGIVTELMKKGNLTSVLENEPELSYRRRHDILVNVASGMARIHDLHFIHRDIRPDNILITENYVAKIGDMGIAKLFDPRQAKHTEIGCIPYMPPEFYTDVISTKLDVFTFGLTMVETYNGKHELNRASKTITVDTPTDVLWYFVKQCIDLDPDNRPTSKEIEFNLNVIKQGHLYAMQKIGNYGDIPVNRRNEIFKSIYEIVLEKGLDENLFRGSRPRNFAAAKPIGNRQNEQARQAQAQPQPANINKQNEQVRLVQKPPPPVNQKADNENELRRHQEELKRRDQEISRLKSELEDKNKKKCSLQ